MNKFIFLLGIIGLLLACESCSERKKVEVVSTLSDSIESSRTEASFPFPEIPAMLTQPEERKAYLLEHYWDRFSFADTALVNNREVTEQGFVNQISLLADGATPEKVIRESLKNWCSRFMPEAQARRVMMQLAVCTTPIHRSTTRGCMECIWRRCWRCCPKKMPGDRRSISS